MSHGLFYRCIDYVSGPGNTSVALRSIYFIENIFICVLKMKEGLTGLERLEGE